MKKIFTILCAALLSVSAFAELAYNATFTQSDFNNSSTVVGKAEGEIIEWDNGEVRCGGTSRGAFSSDAWNWNDKYFVVKLANGVPDKLTFQYVGYFATTNTNVYVKESANGSTWTDLWSTTSNASDWTAVTKTLQPTTRYLRFGFSGNFSASFKDIKVTEKILMGTPNPTALDFGTVKVDDVVEGQTFTLGWTNLTGTATSSDAHFTVTPDAFGEIGANLQTTTFTVSMVTSEAGTFNGTIDIAGRDKSAQVTVTGIVEKYNQTINWAPAEAYNYDAAIPVATATSDLAVSYEIADPSVLVFENGAFRTLHAGTTTVTAKQAGNYKYNAAENVVKTIQVNVPATYGDFEEISCDTPVEFNGVPYTESFAGDVNVGLNYLGGDSLVHVNIIINHATAETVQKTIVYGADESWNGINLSDSTVGQHTVVYTTANVAGCDSVVTLNLTVTKQDAVELTQKLEFCEGDSAEFRGVWYTEAGENEVYAEGEVSDTVYTVVVTVNEPTYEEDTNDRYVGEVVTFEEGWLLRGETPVTEYTIVKADTADLWFILYSTTVNGCDSIFKLDINVELLEPEELEQELFFCPGESIEYRGKVYDGVGKDTVFVEGEVRDTVVYVNVTTLIIDGYDSYATVAAGDVIELDGEWYLGETLVSDTYQTSEEDVAEGLKFIRYEEVEGCQIEVAYIVKVTSREGVENIFVDKSAEKFFRDGVLYIRRGEAVYNANGERVE